MTIQDILDGKSGAPPFTQNTRALLLALLTLGADGGSSSVGATTDAAVAAGASGTLSAKLRRLTADLAAFMAANHADLTSVLRTSDAGPAWTTVRGVAGVPFTSADQSAAVASVTDAPTAGQKIVVSDLVISSDTAMAFSFSIEDSATVIYGPFYLGANQTVNLVTRGKLKLGTADKKLQVKTSAAGNISVLALYSSEA